MNKKIIGVVLALALVGLVAFGGFRSTNNHEVMDDDMNTTNEEMMDKDEMQDDEMMNDEMKEEDKEMMEDEMKEDDMKSEEMKDEEMVSDDKEMMEESKDSEMMDADKDAEMMDKEMDETEMKDEMKEESKEMMKNDGKMAQDFTLKNLDGEDVMLSSLQGEKVYVKFWASWCSICLAGLDDIDMLAGEDDFRVITIVSPGHNGEKNTEDFKEWFATRDTKNLEVLLDEGGAVTKAYGVRAYPTSVYIGSDGVLVKVLPGHNNNDNIKAFFENIH